MRVRVFNIVAALVGSAGVAGVVVARPGGEDCCAAQFSWDLTHGTPCTGSSIKTCQDASSGDAHREEGELIDAMCTERVLGDRASFIQNPCSWNPTPPPTYLRHVTPLPGGGSTCCFWNPDDIINIIDTPRGFQTSACDGIPCPNDD